MSLEFVLLEFGILYSCVYFGLTTHDSWFLPVPDNLSDLAFP
jgi:hypothetical protein